MANKVIVTGGAGFIGSNLAELLLEEGYDVHIVDDLSAGKRENVPKNATLHEVSILDGSALDPIFQDAHYIFHLAANPRVQDSIDNPIPTNEANVTGTIQILEAAKRARVKKVVFSSSAAVYGDQQELPFEEDGERSPISPYGLHKFMGEHLCRLWSYLYDLPTVSLRYFNVYGPKFDPHGAYPLVVGKFLELKKNNKPLTISGDGTNTRDYVHVRDVARANLLAATSDLSKGEVINVASGEETSVLEIAELIGGELEYTEARIEPKRNRASIARAQELLGWEPTVSFNAGVEALKKEYL